MLRGLFSSKDLIVIDGVDKLSPAQKEALSNFVSKVQALASVDETNAPSDAELLGYLKVREFDQSQAQTQYESTIRWRAQNPAPKINEIAPFLRSAKDAEGPDGCIFLLERKGEDCARDILGRPVIVSIGMLHGSALEMQRQMIYALSRAKLYFQPGKLQNTCTVIEVVPKKGTTATFRFPDKETKGLMDLQKQVWKHLSHLYT